MRHSEQFNEIAAALAKAQGAIEPAPKDSKNPHFNSKYADLASIREAARKPLAENGLAVLQDVAMDDDAVSITTMIVHTSGQWFDFGPLHIPVAKSDAQGVGSAITYGKRYQFSTAIGVVADADDDGNAAANAKPAKTVEPVRPSDDEVRIALESLTTAAADGMGGVQAKMETLSSRMQAWLRTNKKAELGTIKATAELNAKPTKPETEGERVPGEDEREAA